MMVTCRSHGKKPGCARTGHQAEEGGLSKGIKLRELNGGLHHFSVAEAWTSEKSGPGVLGTVPRGSDSEGCGSSGGSRGAGVPRILVHVSGPGKWIQEAH